jgi:hypothetical protein
MPEYPECKQRMIEALEAAARAQEARDLAGIATGHVEIDCFLPRGAGPEYQKLFIALNFWDGWIDSCNHGWRY